MCSDVHNKVGTPHMKLCSDHHNKKKTLHMEMCSDSHTRSVTARMKICLDVNDRVVISQIKHTLLMGETIGVLRLSPTIPNLVWFAPIFFLDLCSQLRIVGVRGQSFVYLYEHLYHVLVKFVLKLFE